jgi:hypothetical protein
VVLRIRRLEERNMEKQDRVKETGKFKRKSFPTGHYPHRTSALEDLLPLLTGRNN